MIIPPLGRHGQAERRHRRPFLPRFPPLRHHSNQRPKVRAARKDGGGGVALFSHASRRARPPRPLERAACGGISVGGQIRRQRARIRCPRGRIRRRGRRQQRQAGAECWRGGVVCVRAWATRPGVQGLGEEAARAGVRAGYGAAPSSTRWARGCGGRPGRSDGAGGGQA
jgi:hypothetical protein